MAMPISHQGNLDTPTRAPPASLQLDEQTPAMAKGTGRWGAATARTSNADLQACYMYRYTYSSMQVVKCTLEMIIEQHNTHD